MQNPVGLEKYFTPRSAEAKSSSPVNSSRVTGPTIVLGDETDNFTYRTEPTIVATEVIGDTEVSFTIGSVNHKEQQTIRTTDENLSDSDLDQPKGPPNQDFIPSMTNIDLKQELQESETKHHDNPLDTSSESLHEALNQSSSQLQSTSQVENFCDSKNQSKNLSVPSGSREIIEPRGH